MLKQYTPETARGSILKRTPPDEFPVSQRVLAGIAQIFGEPLTPEQAVTRILKEVQEGDLRATDRLLVAVYDELRGVAARKLSHERPGQTLQATALVHEAYLRLLDAEVRSWENSVHFFSAAAEAASAATSIRGRLSTLARPTTAERE